MENLEIYNELRSVPKEAQKSFSNGRFSGTDINPMWRIKKLTETFGVCGFGWYYDIASREIITSPDGTMCAFVAVKLYVKQGDEWSKPIYGEGGNTFATKTKNGYVQTSDEAYKMALTDAVSNATKQLGLGADIWFEKDATKYTANQAETKPKTSKQDLSEEMKAEVLKRISGICNEEALNNYYKELNSLYDTAPVIEAFRSQKINIRQSVQE